MIVCCDYASLYPHMMIGGNLFSPARNDETYWQGKGVYASHYQNTHEGIKGRYSTKQGKIEHVLHRLLQERLSIKDNPQKKLALKILINTMYGIMGSPKFKSVHNLTSASDVTSMARRSILHARTIFEEWGYECIYTDTDSVYIKDSKNDLDKLNKVLKYISDVQKGSMNIPVETHGLKIECFIKRMYFFRNESGEFIKKHYAFVTDQDELVIKGLKIKQGNCSKLAKKFFEEKIKNDILDNKYQPYEATRLLQELKDFSVGKEDLLQKRYRVNAPESYKIAEGKEEASGLHYQIAKRYNAGEHWLVINKRIGAGKGNRYAKLEELKEKYGEHYLDQICFEEYMKDLSEFIKVEDRNKLSKTDRRRITHGNTED